MENKTTRRSLDNKTTRRKGRKGETQKVTSACSTTGNGVVTLVTTLVINREW
jgi:hypothetical protein